MMDFMQITIEEARPEDLEAILALQKVAYISEAELINDFTIPPLHQTEESIKEEYKTHLFLIALDQNRQIVGSVRAGKKEESCHIGKLIVNPDCQNRGIGKKLMAEIERRFEDVKRFELFTGSKSSKNLTLYEKLGYKRFRQERISETLTLVFLEK